MELLKSIAHPEEVCALLKYKFTKSASITDEANCSPGLQKCYEFLRKTSRSFSAVIQALDSELRDAVCIFYLVLRALDTVEDDMTIAADEKLPMLKNFNTFLLDQNWKYLNSKEKDRIVLEEFPVISAEYRSLQTEYQEVISDICQQMGSGMIVYYLQSLDTVQQWDEYCHYVAGLVGIGLSRLFSISKLEAEVIGKDTTLANSMGLFLQKTNIIRDYLEDTLQGRCFWPRQVWSKYAVEIGDLATVERRRDAVACLNELITNALSHVPDVLEYLSRINNQSVFNFCAIPQVMAIATLERCYNNQSVFCRVVKIRKGEAVRLMLQATDINTVKAMFSHFISRIQAKVPADDPSSIKSHQCLQAALTVSKTSHEYICRTLMTPVCVSGVLLVLAILWQYWTVIVHFCTRNA